MTASALRRFRLRLHSPTADDDGFSLLTDNYHRGVGLGNVLTKRSGGSWSIVSTTVVGS